MSNRGTLGAIAETEKPVVGLPQPPETAGVSLPERPGPFTMENVPQLTSHFQSWFRSTYGDRRVPGLSTVFEWAESQHIELTAASFKVVSKIFEEVRKAEEAKKKLEMLQEPNYTSLQQWSKIMQREVDLDREEKEKSGKVDLDHEEHLRKTADEISRRESTSRDQLRGLLLSKPLTKDGSAVKNLEWMLTTKNLPPEDLMEVMAYLAEIAAMHPARCSFDSLRALRTER